MSVYVNAWSWTVWKWVVAENGGAIDLSSVQTISGAGGNDWASFVLREGGDIRLDNLQQATQNIQFDVQVPNYTLPSLVTAEALWVKLAIGTRLDMPELADIQGPGARIEIPTFATLSAPNLTHVSGTEVDLAVGGKLIAPNLTTFTDSAITISPGRFLVAPPFGNVDGSRLFVEDGGVLRVAATSYTHAAGGSNDTVLRAAGSGSLLDMSAASQMAISVNAWSWTVWRWVVAEDGGMIDLKRANGISGSGGNDWTQFIARTGGSIRFGNVVTSNRVWFDLDGSSSRMTFDGLHLNNPSRISAASAPRIDIAGDFTFDTTNEDDLDLREAVVRFNGQGVQRMEVGGADIGLPSGSVIGNFEIGQLVVGQDNQPTILELVDDVDNGNRDPNGAPEVLYLQGFTQGQGGLRIRGGSVLVIHNLKVYATDDNQQWFLVNDLFPVGVNTIPFDGGFISLTSDCNTNGVPDDQDVDPADPDGDGFVGADCNGNGIPDECEPDCNNNGVVDDCDVDPTDPDGDGFVSTDCDGNGIPDECESDCNGNGIVDACDVDPSDPDGDGQVSPDCDVNGVPDVCDPDCNNNGTPDACEVFDDCNFNGVPDECELAGNDCNNNGIPDDCEPDCNTNGVPDECDIANGTSPDCNNDGVPDECQLAFDDCNGNSVPDECDIASGTSADCNGNGIPDECDIADGTSADCNNDGVPDECQTTGNDCDNNGVPDECDPDCNGNGIPDACDIASGTSSDCNGNGVPDECELSGTDCNNNGVLDVCDIASGTSADCDGNGIPDECENFTDCNGNGTADRCDIASGASSDANGDGIPDECQVLNLTQNTVEPSIAAAISHANPGDVLLAAAQRFDAEPTIDFAGKALTLRSTGPISQPGGGLITLADGVRIEAASGQDATLAGGLEVPVIADGTLAARSLTLDAAATLTVRSSAALAVGNSMPATLAGTTRIESQATLTFAADATNTGSLALAGGTLAAASLSNAGGASLSAFGNLQTNVTNDGDVIVVADTQVVGDYTNNGTTIVQNGTLTVLGTLTNNGTIIGDIAEGTRLVGSGLSVLGDYVLGPQATLVMAGQQAFVRVGGHFDCAIDSHQRYDMATATLQLVGLGEQTQNLEVMSTDIGADRAGLDRTQPGHYPIGTLRIGPTPTTVALVDAHDNDGLGQAACEAIYVQQLVLDAGTTLVTGNCRIYYGSLAGSGSVDNLGNLIPLPAPCVGDLDGDQQVGLTDLSILLANFGITGATPDMGDLDGDGDVDLADLSTLLGAFGQSCP